MPRPCCDISFTVCLFVCPQDFCKQCLRCGLTQGDEIWQGRTHGGSRSSFLLVNFGRRERALWRDICCPLKSIRPSVAGCGPVLRSAYMTEKSILLLARLATAGDSLARHAGCVAAGRIADCGLAIAIGIVGTCGSPNNCCTCYSVVNIPVHRYQYTIIIDTTH